MNEYEFENALDSLVSDALDGGKLTNTRIIEILQSYAAEYFELVKDD